MNKVADTCRHRRSGLVRAVRIGLLMGLVSWTTCQHTSALAQAVASPPTSSSMSKLRLPSGNNAVAGGCSTAAQRFCPLEAPGSSSEISCLRQNYLSLPLSCRSAIRATTKAAEPGESPAMTGASPS